MRLTWFVIAALLGTAAGAWAHDDILPLKDVKVGMKGIGKTVIHGREIETFNVEILGILANNKINENVVISGQSILVRVSGKVIEEAGGIAAGMSGSPIYINGKLVGGLSSGWVMTDHTIGLVTPIEEMLEIWDYPLMSALPPADGPRCWQSPVPVQLGNRFVRQLWEVADESEATALPTDAAVFAHARTPIVVEGLTDRALAILSQRLHLKHVQGAPTGTVVPAPAPGAPVPASPTAKVASDSLEPGSAIGVQLARGDINLTSLGTLTYREGKKILAFAHPFMKKGNVAFLMTGSHIYHSFSSVQMPFKIGAPTDMVGIITQDREKGISGEIGRFPQMIPVQVDVTDKDLKRSRSINYQVVRDPAVLITVLESTLLQAIEGVMDRDGEGAALLGIALECANTTGTRYSYRRENLFYSRSDLLGTLIDEVCSIMESVSENDQEEVHPTRLLLKIEIERKRRTLTIEKVEVKNTSITPGGMLEVWVTLRPFREKAFVRKARLAIPHDIGKENLTLTVYGLHSRLGEADTGSGETGDPRDPKSGSAVKDPRADEPPAENFEGAMRTWVEAPRNSDLLFQLTVEGDETKKIKLSGRDFETQPTNHVVIGRVESTITLSEE